MLRASPALTPYLTREIKLVPGKNVFIGGCGTTIDKEHKDVVTVVARISSIFRRDVGV